MSQDKPDTPADRAFDDCVVLSKDAFDPDAVFLDDIVDDEVLPNLTLRVDGLTEAGDGSSGSFELRPEDMEAPSASPPPPIPRPALDPEQLEVDGWESTLWLRLRRYVGL